MLGDIIVKGETTLSYFYPLIFILSAITFGYKYFSTKK